jgi:lambda repressor-like predicted transcriptional regulator
MESERQNEIRNEIKAYIARSGWTMTDIVKEMNKTRPEDQQTTTQNITNKLARGTIKYSEVLEIAKIIGYEIKWEPKKGL